VLSSAHVVGDILGDIITSKSSKYLNLNLKMK